MNSRGRPQASPSPDDIYEPSEPKAELSRQHDGKSPANENARFEANNVKDEYESMMFDGKPYLCAIPFIEPPNKNETAFAQAKAKAQEEEASELARATTRGWELLKDMEGSCMYYISGWWSYSFCYNIHVKQFHHLPPAKDVPVFPPVEDQSTPSYVLGKFSKKGDQTKEDRQGRQTSDSRAVSEMQAKGDARYLVQRLGGGTTCDLTGRERRIEVQFHCHPQSSDRIGWIKEISTCSYLMVIYTPRLCNDVAFLPTRDHKAHAITCREVVKEEDIPAWERSHHQSFPPPTENLKIGSSRPVVAGIEVGGMAQVGKPGFRLEPPNMIVHPDGAVIALEDSGKSELLARQDAGGEMERLPDEQLKKMGLNPQEVAKVRQKVMEMAKGKPWKLEVFDGAEGRELRGVLEEGDTAPDGEERHEEGEEGSVEDLKDEL